VDPIIQFPTNSQSLNGYSYLMNNPLAGVDPTGYSINNKTCTIGGQYCIGDEDGPQNPFSRVDLSAKGTNGAKQKTGTSTSARADNSSDGASSLFSREQTANLATIPDSLDDPNWDPVVRETNRSMLLGKISADAAINIISNRGIENITNDAKAAVIGLGILAGGAYVAAMGTAASEIYEGYAAGMGAYALLANGGTSTAIVAGGLEGAYMAATGVPGTGTGYAGMEAVASINEMKAASQGVTMFHGTSVPSGLSLLNGAPLNAVTAAANKADGQLGFYLATSADDASFFAARRSGPILQYDFSSSAVRSLGGLPNSPISAPPGYGRFVGNETVISPRQFDAFNSLRQQGQITVRPFNE
jgi:hypothetical protein